MASRSRKGLVLVVALVAGTLDIGDNLVLNHFRGVTAARVFRYIASALMGVGAAQRAGAAAVGLGVAMHYGIALVWTALFFHLRQRLALLRRRPVAGGLVYGAAVWLLMNLVAVPHSRIPDFHMAATWTGRLNSIIPVVLFMGLTVSLLFHIRMDEV